MKAAIQMTSDYDEMAGRCSGRVPEAFDRWVRRHGIEAEIAPVLYTVVTWVKHCSMPGATERQLALAHIDLAISFFYLDDYQGDDYEQLFDEFQANLDGETPTSRRSTTLAHADFLGRLRSLGHPMEHFLETRRQLLDEYRFRNAVMRGEVQATFDRYMASRLVTIDVYQWLELWLVIQGIWLTPAERSSPAFVEAVRLAATFYFLGNDLYSVERDAASGEPNLVCLLRDEKSVTLEDAAASILRMKDAAHRRFSETIDVVVGPRSTTNLRRCGEFLLQLVASATGARHDNPERYVPPESLRVD